MACRSFSLEEPELRGNLYRTIRPLLFSLDPETAHDFVAAIGRITPAIPFAIRTLQGIYQVSDPLLHTNVFGIPFRNPVGVAAGFDKYGSLVSLFDGLGFGFLEVGAVTSRPSKGNPKPRLFRLADDQALINRMGLNNPGPWGIAARLGSHRRRDFRIGINIAKTNDPSLTGESALTDFVHAVEQALRLGDFLVLNVSCPNTKDGKTFEEPSALQSLLERVSEVRSKSEIKVPVLVKFSADISLPDLENAVRISDQAGVDGFVLVNTSLSRSNLKTSGAELSRIGVGGLSGRPLREQALARVALTYQLIGKRKPIIGVGGIDSAEVAYDFIRSGASLIEIYTALVYEGPGIAKRINQGLLNLLKRDGFKQLADAVGVGRN